MKRTIEKIKLFTVLALVALVLLMIAYTVQISEELRQARNKLHNIQSLVR